MGGVGSGRPAAARTYGAVDPTLLAYQLVQDEQSATFERWLPEASPELRWDFPHIVAIRKALDLVTAGEVKRLAIAVPPQHGKSSIAAIRYPVWRIVRNPRLRVIVGSYNEDQASVFSREARKVAAPWVSFARDVNRVNEWQTTAGGGMLSVGTTGGAGKPADLFLIDDAFKDRSDADSLQRRDAVWNWYTEVVLARRPQAIVLIGTRWHEDDLMGRLLSRKSATPWTTIRLPAIAEDEVDPLGRAIGAPLCPELMTLAQLEEQRDMNAFSFEALYQGRPAPRDGYEVQVSKIRYLPLPELLERARPLRKVRSWDLSYKGGPRNDETAGALPCGPDADGNYYIADVVHGVLEPNERDELILATAKRDGWEIPIWGPLDPGPGGQMVADTFVRMLDGYDVHVSAILKRQGAAPESKYLRAEPFIARINGGKVFLPRPEDAPWVQEWIEQARRFPRGRRDDMIDATALG